MKQRDDSKPLYDRATFFDKIGFFLFVINTTAAVTALLVPGLCPEMLFWVQLFTASGYVIDTIGTDGWLWFTAEQSRRTDCISNGFGVNLSEKGLRNIMIIRSHLPSIAMQSTSSRAPFTQKVLQVR